MIGRTLSHFEITALIGRGGMGEVYRARDMKLGREVAIKILPEAFTRDAERLARFEREARVLASLDHPQIAGIHELDEAEVDGSSVHFLVLELAEGMDLAEVLSGGPLGLHRALAIGVQIAQGLETAHELNIVHRDLKPANVMLTGKDRVKILDFGLAKMRAESTAADPLVSNGPTRTAPMTRAGSLLGTLAYMSPEQARGQEVDERTDIWAFGAVLFEMLSGRQAFAGDSSADTLAGVLGTEPEWECLPKSLPPPLERLIRRCLAKDPSRRLRAIGDARLEMEEILESPLDGLPVGRTETTPTRRRGLLTGLVSLAAAAAAAFLTWTLMSSGEPLEPPRGSLSLMLDHSLEASDIQAQVSTMLTIAPDGSTLAYQSQTGDVVQIYLMRLDGSPTVPVLGASGGRAPFFSPDATQIGFLNGTELKIAPLRGGAPITVGTSVERSRAFWDAELGIVYSGPEGIFRLTGTDFEATRLAPPAEGRQFLKDPVPVPGGTGVLLTSRGPLMGDPSRVEVLNLRTGERSILVENGGSPSFAPSPAVRGGGYLVYGYRGRLFAAPLSLSELKLTGPAVEVADNVLMLPNGDAAQYSFSRTGRLVYVPASANAELVWVDLAGRSERLSDVRRPFAMPRLSPDGRQLAVEVHEIPHQIWLLDLEKDLLSRFTLENSNHNFAWYPDGHSILYTSDTGDGIKLLWKDVDSAGEPVTVYAGEPSAWISSISRDGRTAAIHSYVGERSYDVFLLPLDGGTPPKAVGPPIPVATSRFIERDPWISPDGRCVAYTVEEAGSSNVFVSCPAEDTRRQVSVDGGREPVWSRDGKTIYFRAGNRMMRVGVEREPEFRSTTPSLVFEASYRHFDPANFDFDPRGERFVQVRSVTPEHSGRFLPIRLDWFRELEEKMEAGAR